MPRFKRKKNAKNHRRKERKTRENGTFGSSSNNLRERENKPKKKRIKSSIEWLTTDAGNTESFITVGPLRQLHPTPWVPELKQQQQQQQQQQQLILLASGHLSLMS